MTDEFDRASELEEKERESAIARQRKKTRKGPALSHCEDCGDEIPKERLAAAPGCRRCIECQTLSERQERMGT